MDWIFSHIWVVVVIAGLVVRVLQAAGGAAKKKNAEPPRRQEFVDAELAERTRKIREEIQRKIAERRGQGATPPSSAATRARSEADEDAPEAVPRANVGELPPMVRKVMQPPMVQPEPIPVEPVVTVAETVRQAAIAEQMKQIVARKALLDRRAATASSMVDGEQTALVAGRTALLDDLTDPAALRRAFVLREVLGPPVALR